MKTEYVAVPPKNSGLGNYTRTLKVVKGAIPATEVLVTAGLHLTHSSSKTLLDQNIIVHEYAVGSADEWHYLLDGL